MTCYNHIVVLTGAGLSAESGLHTFRDKDGIWARHDYREVATPEGYHRNPVLVLNFYNERRRQNAACKAQRRSRCAGAPRGRISGPGSGRDAEYRPVA